MDKNLNIFRMLRIARDVSSREIAEKLRVTPAYISLIESGKKKPSTRLIKDYAEVLGVSEDIILNFKPENNNENLSFEKTLLKLLYLIVKN